MRKLLLALCLLFGVAVKIDATTAYNGCPDFSDLNASYVEPYASGIGNHLVDGRHTIMTANEKDPRTDSLLNVLPDGENWSVKLGNEVVDAQNESISYHFTPDKDYPFLLVKYAVVLQNPGHPKESQAHFSVSITDDNGKLLSNNSFYEVYANNGAKGFNLITNNYNPILWRDWSDILVDLSPYIGRDVHVTFKTSDCLIGGHYGYAYFNASCLPFDVTLHDCSGNGKFSVSLPDGFTAYMWSDGSSGQTFNGSIGKQGLWCDVTSVMGAVSRFYFVLADKSNPTADVEKGTVCEGEDFNWRGFTIRDTQTGICSHTCFEVDPTACTLSRKTLLLNVKPTVFRIDTTICEGEDYTQNGFNIINPPLGVLTDTLYDKDSETGCDITRILNLKVISSAVSLKIVGDDSPCIGVYKKYEAIGTPTCVWEMPENVNYTWDSVSPNSSTISVSFRDTQATVIRASYTNGCSSVSAEKRVKPAQAVHEFFNDTICLGSVYNRNGWNLGIQDKSGSRTYIKQSDDSCGSTSVLLLYVLPKVVDLRIKGDSVICQGQNAILTTADSICKPDSSITVGDILCTDDSIIKFSDFLNSGKTAKAIVFEVEPDGKHGNAISITDVANGYLFSFNSGNLEANHAAPLNSMIKVIHLATLLNSELSQIEGADLLTGQYWANTVNTKGDNPCNYYISITKSEYSCTTYPLTKKIRPVYSFYQNGTRIIQPAVQKISYLWNTGDTTRQIYNTPKQTTTYTVTATNNATGCKTSAKKTVVVNNTSTQDIYETICEGETYDGFGILASEAGDYTSTISSDSCDASISLHLSVVPKYKEVYNDEVCMGQYYEKNGFSLTPFIDGNISDTLSFLSQMGCDSTLILNLKVKPVSYDTISRRVCQSDEYQDEDFDILSGLTTGTHYYMVEKTGDNGCKLYHTLALQVDSVYTKSLTDEVSQGYDYKKYGFDIKKVREDGNYSLNLKTENGCDSTVNLRIHVLQKKVVEHEDNDTICEGKTIDFFGQDITTEGIYIDTTVSDTAIEITTLQLTVNPVYNIVLADTVCSDSVDNEDLMSAPTVLQTVYGCDSIIIHKTHFNKNFITRQSEVICYGSAYNWQGQSLSAAGTYRDTLVSRQGCDSIIELNLSVANKAFTPLAEKLCEGDSYSFAGKVLTKTGTYIDSLLTTSGCDSIVILKLTVAEKFNNTIIDTICEGYNYLFADRQLTKSGIYADSLLSNAGCDSVTRLNLVVLPLHIKDTLVNLCGNEDFTFNAESYTDEGTYLQFYQYNTYCEQDSISIVRHISPAISQIEQDGKNYIVYFNYNEDEAPYRYLLDNKDYPTSNLGELKDGLHLLYVTDKNGCYDSLYFQTQKTVENRLPIEPMTFFSPDGNGINDIWQIKNIEQYPDAKVEIYDRYGKLLATYTKYNNTNNGWNGKYNGHDMPTTDYWYIITTTEINKTYKGHFTLIRK